MNQNLNLPLIVVRHPWNKGKLIGAKPPLRSKHVWSIRTKLQLDGRARDLALFNLALDSKLRGCDVVSVRVDDIAPRGYAVDRATVRQKKTGRPVRFEIAEQTRQALDDYMKGEGIRNSSQSQKAPAPDDERRGLNDNLQGGVALSKLPMEIILRSTEGSSETEFFRQPFG